MNEHFEAARDFVKRAGEEAKAGIETELESIQERIQDLADDVDPDSARLTSIREDLEELEDRAEGEAREAIADARERIDAFRNRE